MIVVSFTAVEDEDLKWRGDEITRPGTVDSDNTLRYLGNDGYFNAVE